MERESRSSWSRAIRCSYATTVIPRVTRSRAATMGWIPTRIEGVLAAPSFKNFASPRSHLGSEPLQRQGIRDDGDGAEPHRGSREDRVQEDAEAHEHARRHRDQGGVVEERPEQVRLDL